MEREEAIRQIENRWDIMDYGESEALGEALDMAIEALSADTVSREEYEEVKAYMNTLVDAFIEDGEELAESVKVVRCKDCKWCMLTDNNETEVCTNKQWDISMAVYPIISADDFCSYGERREP